MSAPTMHLSSWSWSSDVPTSMYLTPWTWSSDVPSTMYLTYCSWSSVMCSLPYILHLGPGNVMCPLPCTLHLGPGQVICPTAVYLTPWSWWCAQHSVSYSQDGWEVTFNWYMRRTHHTRWTPWTNKLSLQMGNFLSSIHIFWQDSNKLARERG